MVHARANPGDVERLMLNIAQQDGRRVRIGFGQDPGQAGKSQAQHLVRALDGFTVTPAAESGDKLTRFGPFSSQCRAGNIKIRRGGWNAELFRVLEGFPELAHDDEVDACSGALEMLNPQMEGYGIFELTRRQAQALKEKRQPPPPAKPIFAKGSMQWQREQEEKMKAQLEAAAGDCAGGSSLTGSGSEAP
jgi:predicted phage terminase large subunit-like protein